MALSHCEVISIKQTCSMLCKLKCHIGSITLVTSIMVDSPRHTEKHSTVKLKVRRRGVDLSESTIVIVVRRYIIFVPPITRVAAET